MEYLAIVLSAVELFFQALVGAFFLWWASKILKYGAEFRILFIASFVAGLFYFIPYFGTYIQWGVFLFILYKFGDVLVMDAVWLSIIAFGIKMGLAVVLMLAFANVQDYLKKDSDTAPVLPPAFEQFFDGQPNEDAAALISAETETNVAPAGMETETNAVPVQVPSIQETGLVPETEAPEADGAGVSSDGTDEEAADVENPAGTPVPAPKKVRSRYTVSGTGQGANGGYVIVNGVIVEEGGMIDAEFRLLLIEEQSINIFDGEQVYQLFWR